jgi:putative spermidine/putrescine transport system permease protein
VILVLEYVVLALPFTHRTLDAGLQAIALPTLVEAARSLGAGWGTVSTRWPASC